MNTPIHVLLVERNSAAKETIQRLEAKAASAEFVVRRAANLEQARRVLDSAETDVILLDPRLPDSDGLDSLKRLHAHAPQMPIIILTSAMDESVALAALRAGAQDCLPGSPTAGRTISQVIRYAIARKQSEEAWRENEGFFRLVWENLSEMVAVVGPDGRRLYNSPSYRQVLGDPAELAGTDSFKEIHPEDRDRIRRLFDESLATGVGRRAEFRFVRRDGTVRFVESTAKVMQRHAGQPPRLLVVSRDVTERHRAESELRQQEAFFRLISENITDLIAVIDRDGRRLYNSPSYKALLGDEGTKRGSNSFAEIHPDDRDRVMAVFKETLATGRGQRLEYRFVLGDGRIHYVESVGNVVTDTSGQPTQVVVVSRDITERRDAERALRESQERFELVIRGSTDGIWDWNVVTDEVYFSPRWKAMLGYAEHEVENNFAAWAKLLHPDDHDRALATVGSYFAGKSTSYELEHRLRHRDGSYRWILARGVALRDQEGRPTRMAGSHVDLTERKRSAEQLEQANLELAGRERELHRTVVNLRQSNEQLRAAQARLIQAAKLESVGMLAAGVAHEVKNPLQTILMGLDYLESLPQSGQETRQTVLTDMRDAVHRADLIVRGLLEFSASGEPRMAPENVDDLIDQSLRLVTYELRRSNVRLERERSPIPPIASVDKNKIEQVLLNLCINAVHAMPQGGTLTVRTARTSLPDESSPAPPEKKPRECVRIEVDDTGTGIAPEALTKIFEPFFTTKAAGQGTGLGLPVTLKIVELHGGTLKLRNRREGGIRATVTLAACPSGHQKPLARPDHPA